jgi:hypothetical protein
MTFQRYKGGKRDPHPDQTHPRLFIDDFMLPGHRRFGLVPPTISYAATAITWPMDLNDQLGDCVIAGMDHVQMAISYALSSGSCQSWGDELVTGLYEQIGGYVPGDPSTDNGCVIQDALGFWRKNAIAGQEILFFGALRNWQRPNRVRAMQVFGPLITGYQLPESAEQQFPSPWVPVSGSPIAGGHCAPQMGELLTRDEIELASWGAIVRASKAWLMDYQDEAWVIGYPGFNPDGLDQEALNAALSSLTGESNPLRLKSIFATGGRIMSDQPAEQAGMQPDQPQAQPVQFSGQGVVTEQPGGAVYAEQPGQVQAGQPAEGNVTAEEQANAVAQQPADPNDKDAQIASLQRQNAELNRRLAATGPTELTGQATGGPETTSHITGASNVSPQLPPNAQSAAARAHAWFSHMEQIAQQAQADIERYVPAGLLQAAEAEASAFVRSIL